MVILNILFILSTALFQIIDNLINYERIKLLNTCKSNILFNKTSKANII